MTRLRVLWVTNLPAPYRRSMFKELAAKVDLCVHYLGSTMRDRTWQLEAGDDLREQVVRTRLLRKADTDRTLYLLTQNPVPATRGADVLVLGSWESPAYLQYLAAAKVSGTATVLFYESTLVSNRYGGTHPIGRARRRVARSVDAVLTAGIASTEAVLSMGVPHGRVVTGFNTVDVSAFAQAAARALRERSEPAPEVGHRFLFVGRLLGLKNIDSIIDAFARIAAPGDRLDIVGEGPERARIEERRARLPRDLIDRVTLHGHLDFAELTGTYASSHTLVLASTQEVWGMVVNEALACGLHAVVSDRCGVAASVAGMQGVQITGTSAAELAVAMRSSREQWRGAVDEPEILRYSPHSSALDAARACDLAVRLKSGQRS